MDFPLFKTENFFEKYEFNHPYLLSASDCETISVQELVNISGASLNDIHSTRLGYTEVRGSLAIRDKIASNYDRVHSDDIIVLGAPVEGIFLASSILLEPKDEVIVLTPAYDSLINFAEHVSGNLSSWPLILKGGKWELDLNKLEDLVSEKTKLIILNFPHNPTGFLPNKHELSAIVEISDRHNVWIFSDEMYRGLEYSKDHTLPSMSDIYDRCISLGGVSKSLGLPGLRFGWLTIKNSSIQEKIVNLKHYTSMCATQMSETLGLMALQARATLEERNVSIIKANLLIAKSFFQKWAYFQWIEPVSGSVSLAKVNSGSAEKLCHNLAQKHGIVLLPSLFMGSTDDFVRFGFGRKNFKENIAVLDSAMAGLF